MPSSSRSVSAEAFERTPMPRRICNLDRLLHALEARGLDGIVATLPNNVFYLIGFNGIAHKSDEPRPYAVILSRHAPEHPILVIADYYLATFLTQPTWVEDIRPFRAVMMPLDLPRAEGRHRPLHPDDRQRRRPGSRMRATELRLRHGQRAEGRAAGAEARSRPRRLRRHGLRASARHRGHARSPTATTR